MSETVEGRVSEEVGRVSLISSLALVSLKTPSLVSLKNALHVWSVKVGYVVRCHCPTVVPGYT